MIGSSSTGFAFLAASWKAMEPAILKAISERVDVVVAAVVEADLHVHHRVAGEDARARRASRMPFSMGLMNSLGMVPPVMSFSKTKPSPGAGEISILRARTGRGRPSA